jgi:hypothetical protein
MSPVSASWRLTTTAPVASKAGAYWARSRAKTSVSSRSASPGVIPGLSRPIAEKLWAVRDLLWSISSMGQ